MMEESEIKDFQMFSHPSLRHTSKVWQYFEIPTDSAGDEWRGKVRCKVQGCRMALTSGGTSPLKRHLARKHKITLSHKTIRRASQDPATITGSICKWIIRDRLPLNIVNQQGFKDFLALVSPDYVVPHSTSVRRRILSMTAALHEELANALQGARFLSLTEDTWTSRSNHSYMIVTGHWLTDTFDRRNCTLAVKHLTQSHTSAYLAAAVGAVLTGLQFQGEVVANTHDGAANIVKAMSAGYGQSIGCAAHMLNLAVSSVLSHHPAVKPLQERCREITTFFNKSSTATAELCRIRRSKGAKELRVRPDVCTRWNSFYQMISRLVELKSEICEVLLHHKLAEVRLKLLAPQEWALVEELVTLFKPVDEATTILSGESYSTYGLLHMVLHTVMKKTSEIVTSVDPLPSAECASIGQMLLQKVATRVFGLSNLEATAILLDPRVKHMEYLSVPQRQTMNAGSRLLTLAEAFHNRNGTVMERKADMGDDFFSQPPPAAEFNLKSEIEKEVARWLTEPCQAIRCRVMDKWLYNDPVEYWRVKAPFYPLLAPLARQVLAIQATSVSCERVASIAGAMVTYRRSRLAPEFVERSVLWSLNWDLLANLRVPHAAREEAHHHDDDDGLLFDDDDDDNEKNYECEC